MGRISRAARRIGAAFGSRSFLVTFSATLAIVSLVAFVSATTGIAQVAVRVQTLAANALVPEPSSFGPVKFAVDARWPKLLPNNWIIGQVGGMYVDKANHIWVLHRPGTITADEAGLAQIPPIAICCIPAPPVLEFDEDGNLLNAWGGPSTGFNWPTSEHGIFVDDNGFVWIGGNGATDRMILKFTQTGGFVMQIGTPGATHSNADTQNLGQPADMYVDTPANEVYVADGYGNNRIIVFNATTGAFKRLWGAYGLTPPPTIPAVTYDPGKPPSRNFSNPVHCVILGKVDGLVYVCDRPNDRVQVFTKAGVFVKEFIYVPATRGPGSEWDLRFYPLGLETYLMHDDGTNMVYRLTNPQTGAIVGQFGHNGRNAGYFHWNHKFGVDSMGNLFTGEVDTGKRIQKLVPASF